jgi:hypothetical protein
VPAGDLFADGIGNLARPEPQRKLERCLGGAELLILGDLASLNAGLDDPKIKARLTDLGGVPMPMASAEFGKFLADEVEKWGKVIRAANIKPE